MKTTIKVKVPKQRNMLVPLSMQRKAGPHVKTNKALRRTSKQKIFDLS